MINQTDTREQLQQIRKTADAREWSYRNRSRIVDNAYRGGIGSRDQKACVEKDKTGE